MKCHNERCCWEVHLVCGYELHNILIKSGANVLVKMGLLMHHAGSSLMHIVLCIWTQYKVFCISSCCLCFILWPTSLGYFRGMSHCLCTGLFHFRSVIQLFSKTILFLPFHFCLCFFFCWFVARSCICRVKSKDLPLWIGNRAKIHFCCVYTAA